MPIPFSSRESSRGGKEIRNRPLIHAPQGGSAFVGHGGDCLPFQDPAVSLHHAERGCGASDVDAKYRRRPGHIKPHFPRNRVSSRAVSTRRARTGTDVWYNTSLNAPVCPTTERPARRRRPLFDMDHMHGRAIRYKIGPSRKGKETNHGGITGKHHGKSARFEGAGRVSDGAVVSKTLIDRGIGTITLFSFAEGQGLSEHNRAFRRLCPDC